VSVVSLAQVQSWLEPTKLTLTALPVDLTANARNLVFTSLQGVYVTTDWDTDCPETIQTIISMYVAGWTYLSAYSQETLTTNPWGDRLLSMAGAFLQSLVDGTVTLSDGVLITLQIQSGPEYYPTDNTAVTDTGQAVKFTMGMVF
jgi:hypothetical protein